MHYRRKRNGTPPDITANIRSVNNPNGTITNSDLEMAGLLLLWLVMEDVCPTLTNAHVALFSDNSPMVHWVQRLTAKHSKVAMQLVRALALRLQLNHASPLTPLHIAGVDNSLTDIPSRSFGSEKKWHCETNFAFCTLYNNTFPLPNKLSWNVYLPSSAITMKVISTLWTRLFTAEEWRRLPTIGKNFGTIGPPMSHLWEWTHSFRRPTTNTEHESCPGLPHESELATSVAASKSALEQSLALSQPLARRFPWPRAAILPKSSTPTDSSRV